MPSTDPEIIRQLPASWRKQFENMSPEMQRQVLQEAMPQRDFRREYEGIPDPQEAGPRHKYGAEPTEVDGFRFRSRKEAARYRELCLLRDSGAEDADGWSLEYFLWEVPFRMPGTVYWCDFQLHWRNRDGRQRVEHEDTKGYITDVFRLKMRMMKVHYPSVKVVLR